MATPKPEAEAPKPEVEAAESTVTVEIIANTTVMHSGELYATGAHITDTPVSLAQLIESKVAKLVE